VNIMSMLVRLQGALGRDDLADQIVLLPGKAHMGLSGNSTPCDAEPEMANPEINLLVGFNSSPQSLAALDVTLWIAYQTRMATRQAVNVQVVYVVDTPLVLPDLNSWGNQTLSKDFSAKRHRRSLKSANLESMGSRRLGTSAVVETRLPRFSSDQTTAGTPPIEQFEEADRILWQARHLAEEWRGSLKTHLRFGGVAEELRAVAEVESASLLVLGCSSANHSLVKALGNDFPCPVLGIPVFLPAT
jgi:nucleotide-binding universal stress UspA family protein